MNWKVLIADDEPKIRRGVRALIESVNPKFEVIAEAEDGEVAMDLAIKFKPDVAFVDVCMPIMDGLEFMRRLEGALPETIAIIVSGHDEFEYARAAVSLRAFEYLLKPVSEDALRGVLAKVDIELASRKETGKRTAWLSEQLERNLPLLRDRFMRDWVAGTVSGGEVEEGAAFLEFNPSVPLTLIAARFAMHSPGAAGSDRGRTLVFVAMRTVLEEVLPRHGSSVFEDDTETMLAVTPMLPEETLVRLMESIERACVAQLAIVPLLASRSVPDPIAGLSDAYEEVRSELSEGDDSQAFVVLARNWVDKHYWDPDACLEDAANELQVSPGHLSRIMKRSTGFPFVEYLNRIRVKKAAGLMGDPSAKVFEIAERVGYRSHHYFCRVFRKVMGVSPTELKNGGCP